MLPVTKNTNDFNLSISTNTEIHFQFKDFPIYWEGLFNGQEIEINQKEYSNNPSVYDFIKSPVLDNKAKLKIIEAIDIKLKTILD